MVLDAQSEMELYQVGEYMPIYLYCCPYLFGTNTKFPIETILKARLITIRRDDGTTKNVWV